MYTKIKSKHKHPIIPIQTNKMLHFLPKYFFPLKNRHRKRLRNQAPHGFTRTDKKQVMLHGYNIFRHPHQQNTSRQTVSKKTRNHVTFPHHTWILHVTVTLQTSH